MRRIVIAACLLLAGCAGQEKRSLESVAPQQAVSETVAALKTEPQVIPAAVRMVIRTATLSLVVDDAAAYLNRIVGIVESQGGYVAETRQWRDEGQLRAAATLRIPAERLSSALEEIKNSAVRVGSETITGQDVSEEYADLGAQLTNLHATEVELRQLLATVRERTQKASEVLEVYKELSKVRGDIDRLQGRVDFLKQMTAMSTIKVDLIPDQLSEPLVEPGWRPLAIARTAARSLIAALKGLGAILIWLVIFALPLGIVFAVLALLGRKLWKPIQQWRMNRQPPSMPTPPE